MTSATSATLDTTSLDALPEDINPLLKQLNITPFEFERIETHLKRKPNFTELAMFSVLWSEHCSYKNSRHLLKKLPNKSPRVVAGPGENAGVIDVGDNIQIAFKIESHNHPTAVEPYQGATTGVGGILRDIFTMNARPIANLNALRFGPQKQGKNQTRNRFLFTRAVKGIGDYGNCTGIPTIGGEVFFDESYSENPLVNAMAIGIIHNMAIVSAEAKGIGNPVLYVGNATGRDGMGGAAFASRELDEQSQSDRPAVQVGDPFTEKLLIEACLEAFKTGLVVAAQDMGAAGLTSSSCEMAAKGGVGIKMNLDLVPAREPGMKAHEYLLSESQERMLFILEKGKEQPVIDVFKKWGLHAVIIGEVTGGEVTDSGNVEIWHQGQVVVNLPAELLTDLAPNYEKPPNPPEPEFSKQKREANPVEKIIDLTSAELPKAIEKMMASENLAYTKPVWRQYDRHVQNNTRLASEALSAGVIQLRDSHNNPVNKALAATVDCNSRYIALDAYSGTASAVAEAVRNLACVGAKALAVSDNLNFGSPDKPEIYYQMYQSIEGMRDACLAFDVPVISGNVSLYNEHSGTPILPAPVIAMVGLIDDIEQTPPVSPAFKKAGHQLALIGQFKPTLAGSEYQQLKINTICGQPPSVDLAQEVKTAEAILNLYQQKILTAGDAMSVQDISLGGLLPTILKCCFAQQLGVTFNLSALKTQFNLERLDTLLFGESNGCYLISYPEAKKADFEKALAEQQILMTVLGTITEAYQLEITDVLKPLNLTELEANWRQTLA